MEIVKQILLVKSSKTNKELKYELKGYRFDLLNEKVKKSRLDSLSKRYDTPFDIVIEIKQ